VFTLTVLVIFNYTHTFYWSRIYTFYLLDWVFYWNILG